MAPRSRASRMAVLILRILTLIFLIAALIVLATDTANLQFNIATTVEVHFRDVYSYRFMLGTIVIGFVYTVLQIGFTVKNIIAAHRMMNRGEGNYLFDFLGDKVMSYLLVAGAAAGFAATTDLKASFGGPAINKFFDKGFASSSLLLIAFVCSAILSVFSSYALPKPV